jgi:hypothetical protein
MASWTSHLDAIPMKAAWQLRVLPPLGKSDIGRLQLLPPHLQARQHRIQPCHIPRNHAAMQEGAATPLQGAVV